MSNTKLAVFIAGAIVGLGVGAGVVVNAAVGDLIYEVLQSAEISGAEAASIADAHIAVGTWSGDRADIIRCCAERDPSSSTGFRGYCKGKLESSAASLPIGEGVQVVGRVE